MGKFSNNIERFTDRAENYDLYRPSYPIELLNYLYQHAAINQHSVIADIGAGTGIFTQQLLQWNTNIVAIEPNVEMRDKAFALLRNYAHCKVSGARAEYTNLPDSSVDLIVCAQSFHWFDFSGATREFKRIVKPNGYVAIIWNIRSAESEFERAYEDFIYSFSYDHDEIIRRSSRGDELVEFFKADTGATEVFDYSTVIDYQQLHGRTLSYSYMPNLNETGSKEMLINLRSLFDTYQKDGFVELSYKTKLFFGQMCDF